jgi:hypothetical protein
LLLLFLLDCLLLLPLLMLPQQLGPCCTPGDRAALHSAWLLLLLLLLLRGELLLWHLLLRWCLLLYVWHLLRC